MSPPSARRAGRICSLIVSWISWIFWMFVSLPPFWAAWPHLRLDLLALDALDDLLDLALAAAAAAAGLAVVGHLLDRRQVVLADDPLDLLLRDAEAGADDVAFESRASAVPPVR